MMYSQNDEERIIEGLLAQAPPGRFLDIGAYDGKTFSNTLRLVELGWGGVCLEPSAGAFVRLLALHGDSDRVVLVNAAVAAEARLVDFYDSGGDAVSTTVPAHVEKWESGSAVRFKRVMVFTLPIEQVFARFGHDFGFINLDVESQNLELLECLPFEKLTALRVVCVEHDGHQQAMCARAAAHGFRAVAENAENLILHRSVG
jgi:FkbM family methyltransferase